MTLPHVSQWIGPDWRPHPRVRSLVTTRLGTHSPPPWQGFNLGANCGDDPTRVQQARYHVQQTLALQHLPVWLDQVHGNRVIRADDTDRRADAVWTSEANRPCVVLTADCLPVLLARTDGTAVAAVHAGWRGLYAGILERAVSTLAPRGEPLSAWLGPAISGPAYQVGNEVRQAFLSLGSEYQAAFQTDPEPDHWRFSLVSAATLALKAVGVGEVSGGHFCTASDLAHFYSFRAEGQTGRFATLVWLQNP